MTCAAVATIAPLAGRTHFVYRCFDAEDVLLYVGCTSDLRQRARGHRSNAVWYEAMRRFSVIGPFVGADARSRARAVEAMLIATEEPLHNSPYGVGREWAWLRAERRVRRMQIAEREVAARAAVGERIVAARDLLGLTQVALAAKVFVTQPAVSQWERGLTLPTLAMQHVLSDALRTTRSRLFREIVQLEEREVSA